jgi:hypothetical protein
MPLSALGVHQIQQASHDLGLDLMRVDADAPLSPSESPRSESCMIHRIAASQGTLHYPAALLRIDGRFVGEAILGYKKREAYARLMRERLEQTRRSNGLTRLTMGSARPSSVSQDDRCPSVDPWDIPLSALELPQDYTWVDIKVQGRPGAYFRYVNGRHAISYEESGTTYLLDLRTRRTVRTPGFVDFIPSPDGHFFVTPSAGRRGLRFYDADALLPAGAADAPTPSPLFRDEDMRDQYPSVGLLDVDRHNGSARGYYRIMTSWYDGVIFRDYVVTFSSGNAGAIAVRPVGEPIVACPGRKVSLPMLSPDGRELAARDEQTARTVIWRLAHDGSCSLETDLGYATSKVAWNSNGEKLAFFVTSQGRGTASGLFSYDRATKRLTRIAALAEANRLAFPDFIGRDSVVFLTAPESGGASRFRIACCVR